MAIAGERKPGGECDQLKVSTGPDSFDLFSSSSIFRVFFSFLFFSLNFMTAYIHFKSFRLVSFHVVSFLSFLLYYSLHRLLLLLLIEYNLEGNK